jgi:c-di-GMP-binding flagellar brake protein YcgR
MPSQISRPGGPLGDTRRHARVTFDSELWLGQDGVFTRSKERIADLSVGGAFVGRAEGFQNGVILSLQFRLPMDDHPVTCTAIVKRVQGGSGIGVEFLDLSDENRRKIATFVEQHL